MALKLLYLAVMADVSHEESVMACGRQPSDALEARTLNYYPVKMLAKGCAMELSIAKASYNRPEPYLFS